MGIVNPFANDGDWTESGGNVYRESGKVGIIYIVHLQIGVLGLDVDCSFTTIQALFC